MNSIKHRESGNMMLNDYEHFSEAYAAVVDRKPIHTLYERPNTWALLPKHLNGLQVLDLGCGTGWYAEQLIQEQAQVTAIDISNQMVTLTKQRIQNRGTCIQLSAETIASYFPPESFDLIIAPLVIHYIKDWKHLFQQIATLLKNNGYCIFSTHQPHTVASLFQLPDYFATQLIEDKWDSPPVTVHYYHQPLAQLFTSIHQSGLILDRFIEPEPSDLMLKSDSKLYYQLKKSPWFLFCRLIKK